MYYYNHFPSTHSMPPPVQTIQPSLPPPIPSTTHPLYKTPPSPPSSTSSSPKMSPKSSPLSSPNHQTLKRKRQPKKNLHAPDYGYSVNFPICPINVPVPNDQKSLVPSASSIVMKKYSTAVDSRKFLTVYEFMVNNQWIIWDYHTGYVHLTGLWKAIGNNKADIVKLIENSPELEPDIKRVRGGYLKIQGTWVPFEIAKALAARTCYFIRYALVPLFGNSFPESCLKPNEPGFGQLQMKLTDPSTKRRRRKRSANQQSSNMPVVHQPQQPIPMPVQRSNQQPIPMPMQHHHHHQPMPVQHHTAPIPFTQPEHMFKHPVHLPSPPHVAHNLSEDYNRPNKRACLSHSYSLPSPFNPLSAINKEEIHLPSIKTLANSPSFKSDTLPPILPPIVNPRIANQEAAGLPSEVLEATRSLQQLSAGVGLGISGIPLMSPRSSISPLKSDWSFDAQEFKQIESNLRSTPPLKSSCGLVSKSSDFKPINTITTPVNVAAIGASTTTNAFPQTPEHDIKRVSDIHNLIS